MHFVLVEPTEPGNIGASARAMKNMGFTKMDLINPPAIAGSMAENFAHNATDILESARIYPTLEEALAQKTLVVGITRRSGRKRGLILPLQEGIDRIVDAAQHNRVALLFGREQGGLFNNETELCGFMLSIPSWKSQPSLNLSHAIMVIAYELSKLHLKPVASEAPRDGLANYTQQRHLYERLFSILELLGYTKRGERDVSQRIIRTIKQFLGRSGLTEPEMKMLHGICTRLEVMLRKGQHK